ncbi:MAG: hypothetical protein JWP10_1373 [Nocardioidaceae bacterium]|nr:hypothetical protein [Nocardioidaceae bacterium]
MTYDNLDRPPLNEAALRAALEGADSWWTQIRVAAESPSTNTELAELARGGAPEGTVLVAEHQTAGRGRLDRSFTVPPGAGLTVSFVVRPDVVPVSRWVWLPLLVGLAVDATVQGVGVDSSLKWPNDVLVDGRKICGILLERVESPEHGAAAVIGIGLNVSMTEAELPVPTATSLVLEGATTLDRSVILRALLRNFEALYRAWVASEGDPSSGIHDSYVRRCATIGQVVRVSHPDGSVTEGEARAIDGFGRLVVGADAISAGDVVHVRPVS